MVKREGRVSRGCCPLIASGGWRGSRWVRKDSPNSPRCLPVLQRPGLLLLCLLRPLPSQQAALLKVLPAVLLPPGINVLLMRLPVLPRLLLLLLLCCALFRREVVVRL